MKLHSIPPAHRNTTHSVRREHRGVSTRSVGSTWKPRVVPHKPLPREEIHSSGVKTIIQQKIDHLTDEITLWIEEFGEDALLQLHEERARWSEILLGI